MNIKLKKWVVYYGLLGLVMVVVMIDRRLSIGSNAHTEKIVIKVLEEARQMEHEIKQVVEQDLDDNQPSNEEILIFEYTWFNFWTKSWSGAIDLSDCEYKNCRLTSNASDYFLSDIVLFDYKTALYIEHFPPRNTTKEQLWLITSQESRAFFELNRFPDKWDGIFNVTATYRHDSTVQTNTFRPQLRRRRKKLEPVDYSKGKTVDMFAMVSNCESVGYNRLNLISNVSDGFSFDFFGNCGRENPCEIRPAPRFTNGFRDNMRPDCKDFHSKYRFFLSFENSLCIDYVTEKFWSVLMGNDYMIPIAMGGLTMEDYTSIAPPDSFLHVDNFTSIPELKAYIQTLIDDPVKFNRYHKWREDYQLVHKDYMNGCKLCEMANKKLKLPGIDNLSTWWNSESNCRLTH